MFNKFCHWQQNPYGVDYARQLGLAHQDLGYWVPGSRSMAYKAQSRPHELLVRYPKDHESPVRVDPELEASA